MFWSPSMLVPKAFTPTGAYYNQLIKMAAIIQRIESAANKGDGADFFDPSELADLLEASELTEVEDKAKPEEEENNE